MHEQSARTSWQRFWNRGGWWRALLLVVVYYVLYQLAGLLLALVFGWLDLEPGGAGGLLVQTGLPILVGGLVLVGFGWSLGWLRELFERTPLRGRWWMWVAVVAVLGTNILRFAALDYGSAGAALVVAWLVVGLLIGFAEEVLTRGFVVKLMRDAGHSEIVVALASAGLFAAMHAGNVLDGQGALATVLQVGYTFAFGLLMYLAYRLTGHLIVPILLHASTDPSIFLLTAHPGGGGLGSVAALGNIIVIATGAALLIVLAVSGGRDRAVPKRPPRSGDAGQIGAASGG